MVPVRTNGEEIEIWKDTRLGDYGTYFNVVYLRNGILCGNLGNATMMNYLEFSIEDGRQLEEREFDVQGENAIRRMVSGAYNPDDDHVYGFSSNIDQSRWYFVKAPACNPEKTEIVREMPADYSLLISCCFSSADNHMYGVDVFGDFIRVDVHGNFEWIGKFDEMNYSPGTSIGRWESGMTYSPKDNAFIWNRQLPDYSSHLVRIEASGDHNGALSPRFMTGTSSSTSPPPTPTGTTTAPWLRNSCHGLHRHLARRKHRLHHAYKARRRKRRACIHDMDSRLRRQDPVWHRSSG